MIIAMRLLLIALFGFSLGACAAESSIVKNVRSLRTFKIVSEETAADGSSTKLVIDCPDGIFSFDITAPAKITSLTFVVKNTAFWEGVDFAPAGKDYRLDLKTTAGASIKADGKDCVITLTGEALKLFQSGGRFQFVNQYRG
jgi:hypothetical protein